MNPERWQVCLDELQSSGRLPSVVAGVLRAHDLVWTGHAGNVPGDPDPVPVAAGSDCCVDPFGQPATFAGQHQFELRIAFGEDIERGDQPRNVFSWLNCPDK